MTETNDMKAQIWSFPGGIHPSEKKSLSNQGPIQKGPLPRLLIVPVRQHLGDPAKPIVKIGDTILKGQLIAESASGFSGNIHAPSSGKVTDIGLYPVQHPSSIQELAIKIETDGKDQWIEKQTCKDFYQYDLNTLTDKIESAGISGLGGAGFPTHIKYRSSPANIHTLIINGAECEPYITADDLLMREQAEEILHGIEILSYILNVNRVLFGIEDNKPEAIRAIKSAIKKIQNLKTEDRKNTKNLDIQVCIVPTKYPSGGEKQLVQLLTGKEIPSGKIPANLGIVCQNVGTCVAVKKAIIDDEPLISRITTVTGSAVEFAGNYEILLGTPVDDLLEHTNANRIALSRLIMGGPMMGFTLHNVMIPVVKTTNCIIAGTPQEFPDPLPEQPCIRCGHCVDVCPASLLPQQLYWYSRAKEFEKAENHQLMDCIECGACAFVCPSNIPLVQYYRAAKGAIKTHQLETKKSDRARERFEFRTERLAEEQREKEARRRLRAAQAAARQVKKQKEMQTESESKPPKKTGSEANLNTNSNIDEKEKDKDKKALKTQYATTQKMVRDANKALLYAEKNKTEGLDKLREKVSTLNQKAEKAKQAWENCLNADAKNTAPNQTESEIKSTTNLFSTDQLSRDQLKIQAAQIKARIKKLETQRSSQNSSKNKGESESESESESEKTPQISQTLAEEKKRLEKTELELSRLTSKSITNQNG